MSENAIMATGQNSLSTISSDDYSTRLVVANAQNNAESLSEYIGVELKIVDVIQTPGLRASRSADMPDQPCTNTYLIDVDGNAYFSQSDGVARSIFNICNVMQGNLRIEGVGYCPLMLVSKELKNGNTLKTVKLLSVN